DRASNHRPDVRRATRARHHARACHPRRGVGAALRPRGAAAVGPHRGTRAHADFRMTRRRLPFGLTARLALRELRAGPRGFHVFMACLALGVMAIAGVGSVARSLEDGLAGEGRNILGGDMAFSLVQREASATERAFLDRQGRVSAAATMRAMARSADGRATLVETKAVDDAYPLYGAVASEPAGSL